ncbi:MBL fold metallo-hydrolase [Leucothrix arctica]|uniref:Nudix hydrolase domain-containing protein n=1 Tax=Leucothrix arctica TaxID=1481894 RepID=A0A317CB07_9GAMM|nr:MBL fold metallo-hydrolase [Leucothrix arctica]PWQ95716.1 hypothetical protein DKT75_11825 [Leucothrix arctica]
MRGAVAAIFIYDNQVFSILRQTSLAAFPGFTAFPGGKIDSGDEVFACQHPLLSTFSQENIGALIREIREELGFDLVQSLEQNQVVSISQFGTSTTPTYQKHRFDIQFYKITLNSLPTFALEPKEVASGTWLAPKKLLQHYFDGDAMVVSATLKILKALADDVTLESADIESGFEDSDMLPLVPFIHDVMHIAVPSHTLPPATTTNSLLIGDKGSLRILTDPSPSSNEILELLKTSLAEYKPDAILLSHHHPDHHERAPQLAKDWNIPILCSQKCQQRLLQRFGSDYLDDIDVRHIQQNDVVTQWHGDDVICHELPGHDDTMVGLAAKNLEWFYVADLVEPGTTVVIPEPEGDMAVYFESLERVIAMQPKHIIPSHGLPVVGTSLLSKTLEHRILRERQILEAHNNGLRDEELLGALYPQLAEQLIPYAEQNIRQHLRKLGLYSEGKVR